MPCENIKFPAEYNETLNKLIEYDDLLIAKLSHTKELSELYGQFKSCRDNLACIEAESNYRHGFKFGMELGIEIFNKNNG